MKHLALDAGNHYVKWAVFQDGKVKNFMKCERIELPSFREAIAYSHREADRAMYCQVGEQLPEWITKDWEAFTYRTPLPIDNQYLSPATLGKDRLAAAVGAWKYFPNQEILVIDCGTCVTIDLVAGSGFLGGAIAPGLTTRRKALPWATHHTLPTLTYPDAMLHSGSRGLTTESAMKSGTDWGLVCELRGWIAYYRAQYPQIQIVITGGDAPFFENVLDTTIFAAPYLVLEGLDLAMSQPF